MSRRTERLAELIKRDIGRVLSEGLGDPRIGFVTITRVELSPDLLVAKVFLSVLESQSKEKTTLQGLNSAKGRFQAEIAENVKLRRVPELIFIPDSGVKHSIRIASILSDLERERAAKDKGTLSESGEGENSDTGEGSESSE